MCKRGHQITSWLLNCLPIQTFDKNTSRMESLSTIMIYLEMLVACVCRHDCDTL